MKNLSNIFNHIKPFNWCDAFYKFGFNDGDGDVRTYEVAHFLRMKGYDVGIFDTGLHNKVINSIKRHDKEILPVRDASVRYGYDHPRNYLSEDIIAQLDKAFPFENALSMNDFNFDA